MKEIPQPMVPALRVTIAVLVLILAVGSRAGEASVNGSTPAPVEAVAFDGEEGFCMGCEQWEEKKWKWVPPSYYWQWYHQMSGYACQGENLASIGNDVDGAVVTLVQDDEEEEEGETRNHSSRCAACGNSSQCHTGPDEGQCHEACPGSGGGSLAAAAPAPNADAIPPLPAGTSVSTVIAQMRRAIRRGDTEVVRELLAADDRIFLNADRGTIQFRAACNPALVAAQIRISRGLSIELQRYARTA